MTVLDGSDASYDNIFIKRTFVACLLCGSAVIIFTSRHEQVYFAFFIPIAIMIIYFFLGVQKSDINRVSDQFADSIYYLGFLYTLVALSVSLYAIHEKNYTLSEGLISRFGLALATTIIGLSFRIYIVNFRQNIDDIKKITEAKLSHNVQRYAHEVDLSVDRLKVFNKTIISKMETLVTVTTTSIEGATQKLDEFAEGLTGNLEKISDELEKANMKFIESYESNIEYTTNQIKQISDTSFSELSTGLKEFTTNLIQSVNYFVSRLDEVIIPQDVFSKKLEEPINELINSLRSTINDIEMMELPTDIFASKFDEPLNQFSGCMKTFSETVENYIDEHNLLESETKNIGGGLINLNNHINELNDIAVNVNGNLKSIKELSLDTNQFATSFKYATEQMGTFNDQTKDHIESTSKLSGQFEKNLNLADGHREKIRESLDEAQKDMKTMYMQLLSAAVYINDKLKGNLQ